MLRMMLMIFSLIASMGVTLVSNWISLNGQTTSEIANRLPVLFTPAPYVFLIWPVIYLLLIIWLFGFGKNKWNTASSLRNRRAFLFVLINLLNIAWTLSWHFSLFFWSIGIMLALLFSLHILYFTYPKRETRMQGRIPIAVYFGWTFIATIVDISYVLTLHDWSGWGLSDPLWTVIYLTIATAFALHFLYHHADRAMNVVFLWVFLGVAIKNGADELFVSAAALFLSAVIVAGIFLSKRVKKRENKNAVSSLIQ